MSELDNVFGKFTPGEIEGAVRALQWAAKEIANANNFTKAQTETLKDLGKLNENLQHYFTTNEPSGFSALIDKKLESLKDGIIKDVETPIQEIVEKETKKQIGAMSGVITAIVTILSLIFWWLQNLNTPAG